MEWNRDAIGKTLTAKIASDFDRRAGSVEISRNATGAIVFSGAALPGRHVDIEKTIDLTIAALDADVSTIVLPVIIEEPSVKVMDDELISMGIRDVVTVGESDFSGSTPNRRHNIRTGLAKFSGHLIPKGSIFSFDETLGPVTAATGYVRELVIQGDRTIPDYGGGLCQVGTTAYRGVWEYGFPIKQRKNHSYTVHYYSPQGTDATVYPPSVDMKFLNDSPGALLIQTIMNEEEHRAYFIYYGTKDARKSEVFGPYTWSHTPAPTDERIEYTTDIPPETKRKVGERVPGMTTSWFRAVTMPSATGATVTETYSSYEARPLFYQIGVTADEFARLTGSGASPLAPDMNATIDPNS
jgi:vancomycin resistance protein YoaR